MYWLTNSIFSTDDSAFVGRVQAAVFIEESHFIIQHKAYFYRLIIVNFPVMIKKIRISMVLFNSKDTANDYLYNPHYEILSSEDDKWQRPQHMIDQSVKLRVLNDLSFSNLNSEFMRTTVFYSLLLKLHYFLERKKERPWICLTSEILVFASFAIIYSDVSTKLKHNNLQKL